jgi:predicted transcriptional regulator
MSDTSAEAYEQIQLFSKNIRRSILQAIAVKGEHGATCDEIEVELGMRHQTASSAITYLLHTMKAVADSGARRTTRSGRKARVYIIKERKISE